MRRLKRRQQGSQLAESLVIGIFILMITLGLVDLIVMVLANGVNDEAAKNAARIASNQPDYPAAIQAAKQAVYVTKGKNGGFITHLWMDELNYDDKKMLTVVTKMEVRLPIPVPGIGGNFTFVAKATEPIVGHEPIAGK